MKFRQILNNRIFNRWLAVVLVEQHQHDVIDLHGLVDDDTLGAAIVRVSLDNELTNVGLLQLF